MSIKWQLVIICVLLVAIPAILLGVMTFNNSRQVIMDKIEESLRVQSVDWAIIAQSYYDLIAENRRVAEDTTEDIIASQASGVLQQIEKHLTADPVIAVFKQPVLMARKSAGNLVKNFFSIDEFDLHAEQYDLAVKNIQKLIEEAQLKNINTASVHDALAQFLEEVRPVEQRRIKSPTEISSGTIMAAADRLEENFSDLADKLSDERLKDLLAANVIGRTGYVYIIDYQGNYILSENRKRDGENIWYVEDKKGDFVIQHIVKKARSLRRGEIDYHTYSWKDAEEEGYRRQLAAIMHFPEKEWVVGVVIHKDELLKFDFEEIKKEELKNLMAEQRLGKTGRLAILGAGGDEKSVYILSEDRKYDGEDVLWRKDAQGQAFMRDIIHDAGALGINESKIRYYLWREPREGIERKKVMAYVYFKPWEWVIIASVDLDESFKDIKKVRNQIILVCIIAVLLTSIIAYFFVSINTRTISQLVNKMKKVAGGNLDVETDDIMLMGNRNEVGQLAGAFKQMADNLRQTTFSKDYVDNILISMNDALFVIDKDMRIITINSATCLLINCAESEILKYPIKDFFMSDGKGVGVFRDRILQGEIIENLEMSLRDKKGNAIPVSINGAPIKDPDGKVYSAILVARDIREYKRLLSELSEARRDLEEKVEKLEKSDKAMLLMVEDLNKTTGELRAARNKLEEKVAEIERINKELDDFTYIVSHDLKEPLRGVRAFTKLLLEDYSKKLDKEAREHLKAISDSSIRMGSLIEDLLNLSRVGRIKNVQPDIDLNDILLDVKKNLAYALEEKKVLLKIAEDLPKITCDRIRISEVFSNLVSNAIKYCRKDVRPVIEVGYSKKGDYHEFYVKDNGIGIEKEYQDRIFQIFQRLHGRGEYEGTGAGLTIVKKIVENHGGRIWVESEADKGSAFYFTVPVS